MYSALARFVTRKPALVVGFYALLAPLLLVMAGSVFPLLKAGGFEDYGKESWQAFDTLQQEFGAGTGDVIAVYSTESGTVTDIGVTAKILYAVSQIEGDPGVGAIRSVYNSDAAHFVSGDRKSTFLMIDLLGDEQQKINTYLKLKPALEIDGLKVGFAGLIPANNSIFETIRSDLIRAELIAFPVTALVVFLVFGSASAVLVLLAAGICGVLFAAAALRLIATGADVSIFALNTVLLLGLGLAVDYSLFLVNRFREELANSEVKDAIQRTLETTGRAVAFSGVTVATSLCGLFVFEEMILRSLAMGGVIVAFGTVVLALTLVPALLTLIGERINSERLVLRPFQHSDSIERNPWYRAGLATMKRPLLTAVIVGAVLLSLALPFSRFSGTIPDWRALPDDDPVRAASELLASEFAPNQGTPHLALLTVDGDASTANNLSRLAELTGQMSAIPGIARIDSVFTFDENLSIRETLDILLQRDVNDERLSATLDVFVQGPYMRLMLVSADPYDHQRTQEQVGELRALSAQETNVQIAGYSAVLADFREGASQQFPWMIAVVMGAMFVILFFAFGSITLPVKALVMNSLSLGASFGAIVWIFQDGRFETLLNYTALGFSDITLPIVMFAIVFGLSMDYEVVLLSRVREEYLRCGDNSQAVALGLARTGRLITSAGVLFLVVVGAFTTSDMVLMKALGVGMALAIFLDITIVRSLLVPATMHLMGRWNWYAPKLLRRVWNGSGIDV
ncbi:MAG: MMPL family transporter [Woeseiaceae bacterium]